jgi:hypothetical protein
MTGARTGTMLLLEKKPLEFIKCVTHVTLGKWIKVGMVLTSLDYYNQQEKLRNPFVASRGPSTRFNLKPVIPHWNKVLMLQCSVEKRRIEVLKNLKCNEEESWGKGCLIFAPVKSNTLFNLKCRYLPLLESIIISRKNTINFRESINKDYINQQVIESINAWKNYEHHHDGSDDTDLLKLIKHLCMQCLINKLVTVTLEEIHRDVFFEQNNKHKVGLMLGKLAKANLLHYGMSGKKRLRCWFVRNEYFTF